MSDTARTLSGRRILVVEDEYMIAMQVKRWLHDAGAEVIGPVPSVLQALPLIGQVPLDAAVLDINLGFGGTAFPIADRLHDFGVPHLFATAEHRIADGAAYGDRTVLPKPFQAEELVQAVAKLVARHHQSSEQAISPDQEP
jgi:DNA-binding response OmpR family regulator